jgi:hypothetical protein
MVSSPSLPVILTCSGCLLALIDGTAYRLTNLLGATARLGFLPKGITRWLYGMNPAKNSISQSRDVVRPKTSEIFLNSYCGGKCTTRSALTGTGFPSHIPGEKTHLETI